VPPGRGQEFCMLTGRTMLVEPNCAEFSGLDHGSSHAPRRVNKRSAVHQQRRGIRSTAVSLVHPTAGTMIKPILRFLNWLCCNLRIVSRHCCGLVSCIDCLYEQASDYKQSLVALLG